VFISLALSDRNFGGLQVSGRDSSSRDHEPCDSVTDRRGCEQGVASSKHTVQFGKEHIRKIRNDFPTKFLDVNGESCADIHARTIPLFDAFILPHLAAGRNVLVSSHSFVLLIVVGCREPQQEHRAVLRQAATLWRYPSGALEEYENSVITNPGYVIYLHTSIISILDSRATLTLKRPEESRT